MTARFADIFDVQDEIARAIVERLKVSFDTRPAPRLVKVATNNVVAYQEYLKGRAMLYRRGPWISFEARHASARPSSLAADSPLQEKQRMPQGTRRVYAGFLEYADHHVGRLLNTLKSLQLLDDTLVYYIIGDNGASAEGTLNGTYNEMINFNAPRPSRRRSSSWRGSTSSADRSPTTTSRWAGPTR